ncbi:MAG: twin-arginine translocase TatA/TatE family subunit [Spirochaetota bacterium]
MALPGIWELLIIALIVLLVFGSNRLMGIMRDMGKEVYKLKDKIKDIENITKNGMK